jgi:DNA-binding MarR family transcriptional regulator
MSTYFPWMSAPETLPFATTETVRDRCLCLRAQRAARALARRFDAALRPAGITNGQFSLLMALNRPPPAARIADLAPFLASDRTTLTAAVKLLERRGLIAPERDAADRRNRRLRLTPEGQAALVAALPLWQAAHDALEAALAADAAALAAGLDTLARPR